ncbi:unnamed protein product [Cyclocybe aegerita]|uniref:Uncharacterized protein n=1 Tax=Cyclocybe aegerita TaxID=1973307 RepID=A0A8S0XHR5_CYCAE|nr:unnamed protein product [Cyclocybe aegerita]
MPDSVKSLSLRFTNFKKSADEDEVSPPVADDGEGSEQDVDPPVEEDVVPSASLELFEFLGRLQKDFLEVVNPTDSVPLLFSSLKHLSMHYLPTGTRDIELFWKFALCASSSLESLELFPTEVIDITRLPALKVLKIKVVVDEDPDLPELRPFSDLFMVPGGTTLPLRGLSIIIDMDLPEVDDYLAVSLPHHGWDTLAACLTVRTLPALTRVDVTVSLNVPECVNMTNIEMVETEQEVFASLSELWRDREKTFEFVLVVKAKRQEKLPWLWQCVWGSNFVDKFGGQS